MKIPQLNNEEQSSWQQLNNTSSLKRSDNVNQPMGVGYFQSGLSRSKRQPVSLEEGEESVDADAQDNQEPELMEVGSDEHNIPGTSRQAINRNRPAVQGENELEAKKPRLQSEEAKKQDVFVKNFIKDYVLKHASFKIIAKGKRVTEEELKKELMLGGAGMTVGTAVGAVVGPSIPAGILPTLIVSVRNFISKFVNPGKTKAQKILKAFDKVEKDDLDKVLAKAAVEIFHNFENQFMEVTHQAGDSVAMELLATDAIERTFNYIANQDNILISSNEITKGVVSGKSKGIIKRGYTLENKNGEDLNTGELYKETGVVVSEGTVNRYYSNNKGKYGYRLPLAFEKEHGIKHLLTLLTRRQFKEDKEDNDIQEAKYTYILQPGDIEQQSQDILSKIRRESNVSQGDLEEFKKGLTELIQAEQKKQTFQTEQTSVKFNLDDPIKNYIERKEKLERLHEVLNPVDGTNSMAVIQGMERLSINPQSSGGAQASISGLGGIGKTQLALKYAHEYDQHYDNNIMWINAETEVDLEDSFKRLATQLGIARKDKDGDKKDIVQEIYKRFDNRKSLFIFDNVENYNAIKKLLPVVSNKPHVLITSRYQNWKNTEINVVPLNVFDSDEAKQFVKDGLSIANDDESQEQKITKLTEELQRLPLALAQAVAYIERNKLSIDDYLIKYQEKTEEILKSDYFIRHNHDPYVKTVLTTWQVTLDKIAQDEEDGKKAIEILNIMAYFNPDDISDKIFSKNDKTAAAAIQLLQDYSMINKGINNKRTGQDTSNVHRLVQEVVRINLQKKGEEEGVLNQAFAILDKTKEHGHNTRNQSNKPLPKIYEVHVASICHYANKHRELKDKIKSLLDGFHDGSILSYFARKGDDKIVSEMLGNDAIKNDQDAKDEALRNAKNEDVVKILVKHGANIDALAHLKGVFNKLCQN